MEARAIEPSLHLSLAAVGLRVADATGNKKVSYRKQVARQHSW